MLSSLEGSFLRLLSNYQASGLSCPKSAPFLMLLFRAVTLTTGRRTSQWKLLSDATEMTLNFNTTTLESRVPALPLSIGMNQGIGMAQSRASGNRVLSLHLQPLRCCGYG